MYWVTGILGMVLLLAPWALGFQSDPISLWTSVVIGALVVVVSIVKGVGRDRTTWEYWLAGVLGLAAIISPFVLNFTSMTPAMWMTTLMGAALVALAGYQVFYLTHQQEGKGR